MSNPPDDERYGRAAVSAGIITEDQLEESLSELRWLTLNQSPISLSQLLREQGRVTSDQHAQLLSKLQMASTEIRMVESIGGYQIMETPRSNLLGPVYAARKDGQLALLRIIPPKRAMKKGYSNRFLREVEEAKRVVHPNVVRVLDAGQEGDRLYYVTEDWSNCVPLAEIMKAKGKLSENQALSIGWQVIEAMVAIHGAGLVHRGLSLDTILIKLDGTARVGELGLADNRLCLEGAGAADYIAPEQVLGKELDGRTDFYALGAILFHLIVGKPPFKGDSVKAILAAQVKRAAPAAGRVAGRILNETALLLDQLQEKDPAYRPPDAGFLLTEIRRAAEAAEKGHMARGSVTKALEELCREQLES